MNLSERVGTKSWEEMGARIAEMMGAKIGW
jgi:hypothetical protein